MLHVELENILTILVFHTLPNVMHKLPAVGMRLEIYDGLWLTNTCTNYRKYVLGRNNATSVQLLANRLIILYTTAMCYTAVQTVGLISFSFIFISNRKTSCEIYTTNDMGPNSEEYNSDLRKFTQKGQLNVVIFLTVSVLQNIFLTRLVKCL